MAKTGSMGIPAAEFEIDRLQKCCEEYRAEIACLTERRDFWQRRATTRQMKVNQLTYEMATADARQQETKS